MENEKLIQEQFSKLPVELQKALGMVKWKEIVGEIAKTNNLSEEDLVRETMFILYGFEAPDDYVANIMRELEIGEDVADKIAEEVDEKIFKVIAEAIESGERKQEVPPKSLLPEIAPEIHPMIEPREMAHEVPHKEQAPTPVATPPPIEKQAPVSAPAPTPVSTPPVAPTEPKPKPPVANSAYSGGADPYREPIE